MLKVSITVSLQMAVIAFRHTDPALADSTLLTYRQATTPKTLSGIAPIVCFAEAQLLFQHAADVISRYARIAAQVQHNAAGENQTSK
eukprot:4287180-Amphidinium_carterae.1